MPLTISQIMSVSYPSVLTELLNGNTFVTHDLDRYPHINVMPCGDWVTAPDGRSFQVREFFWHIHWNDFTHQTEHDKITLVAELLKQGFKQLDYSVLRSARNGTIVLSPSHKYHRDEIYELDSTRNRRMRISHTGAIILPTLDEQEEEYFYEPEEDEDE